MPDPIVVVGGDSMVGRHLASHLRMQGTEVLATTRRREQAAAERPWLDLAESPSLDRLPANPGAIVVAAAVARMAACRADPEGSAAVNVTGPLRLATEAAARGIPLLFLSTDKVFDGARPDRRSDEPCCPVSVYGRQKAATEAALRSLPGMAILRLSRVIAPEDALMATWAEQLRAGQPLAPFSDLRMAPLPVDLIARLCAGILGRLADDPDRAGGVWQLSGSRDLTYAEAAFRLAGQIGADPALVRPVPGVAGDEPPARFTTLDSGRAERSFGIGRPDPDPVLDAVFAGV
ncbi:SDR family oxidoreductase [Oleisolibacter albus]|uniref:SDR family oxidoreductase n=1 Tax=Oleisolibacter albus TaxID=2171757 RepID=UPI000DF33F52|nr:sugar nucleotide-binding protein [Oleisolibacter albus]